MRTRPVVLGCLTIFLLGGCGDDAARGGDGGLDLAADTRQLDDGSRADGGAGEGMTQDSDPGSEAGTDLSAPADGGLPPVKVPWESGFSLPAQDKDGFSQLIPSSDSRIVYVDSSSGDDGTAKTYALADGEVGADPRLPVGPIKAYKTIDAALAQLRDGQPDWLLLKRDESWKRSAPIQPPSGRSKTERLVLGAYGPGSARPLLLTGQEGGLRFWKRVRYIAVVGLDFYAQARDPAHADFVGFAAVKNNSGFQSYSADAARPIEGILIEDCVFRFYAGNTVQGTDQTKDFIVRRSQIRWNYSSQSHSQGIYSKDASVLLEENFFDHNGWYKQSYVKLNDKAEGQATYFNHNTYFTNTKDTIFRRNLFLRASSIGNKFTANPKNGKDEIMAENILLDDNLYVEGEIAVSAGGNDDYDDGQRFKNVQIVNNVAQSIGHGRPTARSLGWGFDVDDWDGGRVEDNYVLHTGNAKVGNIWAINVSGHSRDVSVRRNVIYGLDASATALRIDGAPKSNLTVEANELQLVGSEMRLVQTDHTAAGSFANNIYFTDRKNPQTHFRVNSKDVDFAGWQAQTKESGASVKKLSYADPTRSVERYMQSQGKAATLQALIDAAVKQSRQSWNPAFTARAINAYIRAGFEQP
jgi:hypothetical protein